MIRKASIVTTLALAVLIQIAIAASFHLWSQPEVALARDAGEYNILNVADGTTGYTTAGGSLAGWDAMGYGSVVIHAISDSSATTSTLTVVPMFSNELNVPCSAVTHWFTGTDYVEYSSAAQYQVLQYVPIDYTTNTTGSLPFTGVTALISYTTSTTGSLPLAGVTAQLLSSTNYTSSLSLTSTGATTITGRAPYVLSTTYVYGTPSATLTGAVPYVLSDAFTYRDPTATITGSIPYVISTSYTYGAPVVTTRTLSAATAGVLGVGQSLALTGDSAGGREFNVYGRCMMLNIDVSYGTITPTIYIMMRNVQD